LPFFSLNYFLSTTGSKTPTLFAMKIIATHLQSDHYINSSCIYSLNEILKIFKNKLKSVIVGKQVQTTTLGTRQGKVQQQTAK
jgi:hypothetical protein